MDTNKEQRISEDVQRQNYEVSLAMADRTFNKLIHLSFSSY